MLTNPMKPRANTVRAYALVVMVVCLAVPAMAAGPGRGEISKRPGNGIEYLGVRYNLSQLMGEAVVNGVFEWRAEPGYQTELPSSAMVWLTVTNRMGSGYIRIAPTIPDSGEGFGMNSPGSPAWDRLIAQEFQGTRGGRWVSAETAQAFWREGFRVTDIDLVW